MYVTHQIKLSQVAGRIGSMDLAALGVLACVICATVRKVT